MADDEIITTLIITGISLKFWLRSSNFILFFFVFFFGILFGILLKILGQQ